METPTEQTTIELPPEVSEFLEKVGHFKSSPEFIEWLERVGEGALKLHKAIDALSLRVAEVAEREIQQLPDYTSNLENRFKL